MSKNNEHSIFPKLSSFKSNSQKRIKQLKNITQEDTLQSFVSKIKQSNKRNYNIIIHKNYQSSKLNINKPQQIFNHQSYRSKTEHTSNDMKNIRIGKLINQYYCKLNQQNLENQKKAVRSLSLADYAQNKQAEEISKIKIKSSKNSNKSIYQKQKCFAYQSCRQNSQEKKLPVQLFNIQKEKLNRIKFQIQKNMLKQSDFLIGSSIFTKQQSFSNRIKQDKIVEDKIFEINQQKILSKDKNTIQSQKNDINQRKCKSFEKYYDIFKIREMKINSLREYKNKKTLRYDTQTFTKFQRDRLSPWRSLQNDFIKL